MLILLLATARAAPCSVSGQAVPWLSLFVPGGPAFGEASRVPDAEIVFDRDDRASAHLSGDGVTLDVEVEAADLELFPEGDLAVTGWLTALPGARLLPGPASGRRMEVSAPLDSLASDGLQREDPPSGLVPCSALRLGTPQTQTQPTLSGPMVTLSRPMEPSESRGFVIPLTSRQGEVLARVWDDSLARRLDAEGDRVLVEVLGRSYRATGWVDADYAVPHEGEAGFGFGMAGSSGGCALLYGPLLECPDVTPIAIRTADRVTVVGEIAPGTSFAVLSRTEEGETEIVLPFAWFRVHDGLNSDSDGAALVIPDQGGACPALEGARFTRGNPRW